MPSTLKLGSTGPDVGALHQALIEAGASIDPTELSKVSYGPSTYSAVAAFQAANGLTPDGICGPKTWRVINEGDVAENGPPGWRLGPLHPDVAPVLNKAVSLVGMIEQPLGSNRGPMIDLWNKAAGIPVGSPWCAAFATGMYASSPKNPFSKGLGSAYKVSDWGKSQKCAVDAKGVSVGGDIFVILRGDGHGHVGLVACDLGDAVATVEGNAGNAIKKLVRKKSDLTVFVRPLGLALKL